MVKKEFKAEKNFNLADTIKGKTLYFQQNNESFYSFQSKIFTVRRVTDYFIQM